jgi:precorrin-3B synthase
MSALSRAPGQRGWCPGVRRPMETGDGLLARVHPPGGILTAAQARCLADAAAAHGNGLLDVTARGNVQIRGVRPDGYEALLTRLDAAGLAEPNCDGPPRLTLLSPFAGIDPDERIDAQALAAEVERAGADIPGLPEKFVVAIDGGGLMPLADVGADVMVAPTRGPLPVAIALAGPDGPHALGGTTCADAPGAIGTILEGFAEMRRSGRTTARRLRDLAPALAAGLASAVGLASVDAPSPRPAGLRAGPVDLGAHGTGLLLALPFGRCDAGQLSRAATWSESLGCEEVRPSLTRGFLLPGLKASDARNLVAAAREAGFIVDPDDPRLSVAACPGAPSCASAVAPTPADAVAVAEAARGVIAAGATLHVSGCRKGCAHPRRADLTLVGGDDGCYGVVVGGTARDPAEVRRPLNTIMALLRTLNTPDALPQAVREASP